MKQRAFVLVFASGVTALALAGNSALADDDKKLADRDLLVEMVMAEAAENAAKNAARRAAKDAAKNVARQVAKNVAKNVA